MNNSITSQKIDTSKPPVASSVLGIVMVIIVEMMFFGGLISAFILAKSGKIEWPPAGQPRLPFVVTFANMLVLLASAFTMWLYLKSLYKGQLKLQLLKLTILLGSVFYVVQAYEWIRILIFGMHTGRGLFTSFFYTIIALHGLHVLIGLLLLIWALKRVKNQQLDQQKSFGLTVGLFWFFVVALWPVLYNLIYID